MARGETDRTAARGPLAGLRMLEFVGLGPAPFAAMLFADFGADVLRIHRKGAAPLLETMDTPADVMARGRPSVALDLKSEMGREACLELVAGADALVEGFRPGVMERLGLGPDRCLRANKALVYGRMTGWGQEGPLAPHAGHDINYIGLTGALHAMGEAGRPPLPPLNLIGDFGGGGMLLAVGVLAAMLHAKATGVGQVVDAAMVDGTALLTALLHGMRAGGLWTDSREANLLDGGAPFYGCYACACGGFVAVGAIEAKFYARLLAGLGFPAEEMPQGDRARWPEMRARMAARILERTRRAWLEVFADGEGCVTPVLDWAEARTHPHMAARGAFTSVAGVDQPSPAPRFSATPAATPTPPEPPGQTDPGRLGPWGLDAARIAALRAAGAME